MKEWRWRRAPQRFAEEQLCPVCPICACVFRPLTQEEIAQRREVARQRHAERMMAEQTAPESHNNLSNSAGPSEDLSKGEIRRSRIVQDLWWKEEMQCCAGD